MKNKSKRIGGISLSVFSILPAKAGAQNHLDMDFADADFADADFADADFADCFISILFN